MTNKRRKMTVTIFSIIFCFLALFALHNAWALIEGPIIKLDGPVSGTTQNTPIVKISGVAQNISEITMNDRHIYIDKKGNFKEDTVLSPGHNVVVIYAKDKFNRETKKTLEFVFNKT